MISSESAPQLRSIYCGAVMAGPMVRISSLAFRIFCAHEGADVVFSEEIVCAKLMKAKREVSVYEVPKRLLIGKSVPMDDVVEADLEDVEDVHVVEFVVYEAFRHAVKRQVVFSTIDRSMHPEGEGALVVAQLGANNPAMAAAAARVICEDVDGIDVNMGCPKRFSVDNGMGAALMVDPKRAGSILAAINAAVNAPELIASRPGRRRVAISFKTRVFHHIPDSVAQLKNVMVHAGEGVVHAITLHARTRDQKSETAPLRDLAAAIVRQCGETHPDVFRDTCFVFNGSVRTRTDGQQFLDEEARKETETRHKHFSAVLISRHAMWDPTVFRAERLQKHFLEDEACPLFEVCAVYRRMIGLHRFYRTNYMFLKYHFTRSFHEFPSAKGKFYTRLQSARTYGEFASTVGYSAAIAQRLFGSITFEDLVMETGDASDLLKTEHVAASENTGSLHLEENKKSQREENPSTAPDDKDNSAPPASKRRTEEAA